MGEGNKIMYGVARCAKCKEGRGGGGSVNNEFGVWKWCETDGI